jgi:hypothetical protein
VNKKQYTEWAYSQMKKYGIPMPKTYSAEEIKKYCPDIPSKFINNHVRERDNG